MSVVKRKHGLAHCRCKSEIGMHRRVGPGVIADNFVNIGRPCKSRPASSSPRQRSSHGPASKPRCGLAASAPSTARLKT